MTSTSSIMLIFVIPYYIFFIMTIYYKIIVLLCIMHVYAYQITCMLYD